MPDLSSISIESTNGVCVVKLGQEFKRIDEDRVRTLEHELVPALESVSSPILIDLSSTGFFSSSFIAFLFRLRRRLHDRAERRFGLVGLSETCAQVVAVTQLDKLWHTFDTVDAGVRELSVE
jgi:anti-anti-sigma factor